MLTEPVVMLLLTALMITIIGLVWSARAPRHGNKKAKNLSRLRRTSGQYWGVSIRNGNCSASKRMCRRGFRLAEAAAALPMSGCRVGRCACRYAGLRERRKKERRSNTDRRA